MATNADMSLKEFAKEMLVEVKKDQEWLTRQKEITGDLQERIDECFKRVQKCDMTKGCLFHYADGEGVGHEQRTEVVRRAEGGWPCVQPGL
jgi:hypothetical protein